MTTTILDRTPYPQKTTPAEILEAIAPIGRFSAKRRLNAMGCSSYNELPQGGVTFRTNGHRWNAVRITPKGTAYLMALTPAQRPYLERTIHAKNLNDLGRKFRDAFNAHTSEAKRGRHGRQK